MDVGFDAVMDLAGAVAAPAGADAARVRAGTVSRVDADGTVWVEVGGGEPVPCRDSAVSVRQGDSVTVEWRASALHVTGCTSAPAVAGREVTEAVAAATGGIAADAGEARGIAAAAQRVARAVNQHFWHDTSGIHVTEATQEAWQAAQTGANVLINSIGQLFRDGTNNLLAIVAGTDPGVAIYDGGGNADANVVASFTGSLIELGRNSVSSVVNMCGRVGSIYATGGDRKWFNITSPSGELGLRASPYSRDETMQGWATIDMGLDSYVGQSDMRTRVSLSAARYAESMTATAASVTATSGDDSGTDSEVALDADSVNYRDPYDANEHLRLGMPAHYQHSGSYRIATAGIDTYTNGPHLTLPPGSYIVVGAWVFQAGSSSGARNLQLGFRSGASGSLWGERERIMAAANNFAVLNVSALRTLTSETTVYLAGSSSMTTASNGDAWITAVRLN